MSKIDNGTFTFNKEELKDFSQVIHELVYQNKELREVHDIAEGVIWNKQIVFAGKIGLMGKAINGCTPNEIEGVTMTEKVWTPVTEDFRLTHCNANVADQDKLVQQMSRINPDFYDVIQGSSNAIGNFLVAKVLEGFIENLQRKIWFSDKLADTVDNLGLLTNGTDKEYFNTFDGLFKQLFINIPTGDARYVEIAKNAGNTYAEQELEQGDAIAILRSVYKKADSRLKPLPGAKIKVTKSLWDAYLDDLENVQNAGAGNTMITENGQMTLTFRGVPLMPMDFWDRNIMSFYDNGVKYDKPHRAVYTVPSNIPIATLSTNDFGDVDAFYDKVTKKNYIDGAYSIDAKHLENSLTVVAY